ncbi:2-methylisocitrate lyase [Legionella norrlandica]|uniref:2-methylisocitrate lyase n=1 Tax=Legionella norrlandica TaxID=1498499 RepID=A0A0A2SRX3_9GAMM|nr:methylisocitrate lyase [Legionella norrlandica]KGP62471.1 2-methylisocitrate lyase [Legionella norrlandica]
MSNLQCSQGKKLREILAKEKPLQIVGTINAYTALQAKQAGFHAIYLSGAGVANASYGLPDLGITTLNDVLEDVRRIMNAVDLPLLVDIDTGWGSAFSIARTIKEMIKAGAAAVHVEDQVQAKRCGHRPGKELVETEEMVDRIKAAVDAKTDPDFIIMARTDALANEGLNKAIDRINAYIEAGADMIFFEGVRNLEEYQSLTEQCAVPVLANITEFGVTPLFTLEELKEAGISLVLYPLSAFRAMSAAAEKVYTTIHKNGTQKNILSDMQTRGELYKVLNYHFYEDKLNELFMKEKK